MTVASSRLRPRYAALLFALGFVCVSLMPVFALDLPWRAGEELALPGVFQFGQFTAVTVGLAFFAISAWRTGRDEARLVSALDAVQAVLAREQNLSALGALAAATAHELGTPLGTIHLAAKELARATPKDAPHAEDVMLIAEQAERCRSILSQLGARKEAGDIVHAEMSLTELIEAAAAPHQGGRVGIALTAEPAASLSSSDDAVPAVKRSPEIIHALGAFIENAAEFARNEVIVETRWSQDEIRISIRDDGVGFSPSILPKLGEPYVSERSGRGARAEGMGLGFFIARTLLERTGARITPFNNPPPGRGAVVQITWPRARLELTSKWSVRATNEHKLA